MNIPTDMVCSVLAKMALGVEGEVVDCEDTRSFYTCSIFQLSMRGCQGGVPYCHLQVFYKKQVNKKHEAQIMQKLGNT